MGAHSSKPAGRNLFMRGKADVAMIGGRGKGMYSQMLWGADHLLP
jgi:hypothetical protein